MKWNRLGALFLLVTLMLAAWILLVQGSSISARAADDGVAAPDEPLGPQHCPGGGPGPIYTGTLDSYCGCTWGFVYYYGVPVSGSVVTLAYGERELTSTTTISNSSPEAYAIFGFEAKDISATYGSLVTVTASYLGEVVLRTARLIPPQLEPSRDREQAFHLAFQVGQPPGAPHINSITITPATTVNDFTVLHFQAFGLTSSPFYPIVSYEWRSNLDDMLGTTASFDYLAKYLQVGQHVITVKALDAKGDWSDPYTATLNILDGTATATTPTTTPQPTSTATIMLTATPIASETITPTLTASSTPQSVPTVTQTVTPTPLPNRVRLPLLLR